MMTEREFPNWEALYQEQAVETMPWFNPSLDPDVEEGAMRFCGMIPNWVRSQGKRIMSTRSSNSQQAPNSRISQCLLTRI